MSIYTKRGDGGVTSLFDGKRISKASLRIELSGAVDELSSALGVARHYAPSYIHTQLYTIQEELMRVGVQISMIDWTHYNHPITREMVQALERLIDIYTPKAIGKGFVIPGSTKGAAFMHMARTICRRAERVASALHQEEPLAAEVLAYINRLSDLLFVYAALQEEDRSATM